MIFIIVPKDLDGEQTPAFEDKMVTVNPWGVQMLGAGVADSRAFNFKVLKKHVTWPGTSAKGQQFWAGAYGEETHFSEEKIRTIGSNRAEATHKYN